MKIIARKYQVNYLMEKCSSYKELYQLMYANQTPQSSNHKTRCKQIKVVGRCSNIIENDFTEYISNLSKTEALIYSHFNKADEYRSSKLPIRKQSHQISLNQLPL